MSRVSTDSFHEIMSVHVSLTCKVPNQTIYHFSEISVEFIMANLVCNYELTWNKLYKN